MTSGHLMNDERLWTTAGRLISGTDGSGRPLKTTYRDSCRLSFLVYRYSIFFVYRYLGPKVLIVTYFWPISAKNIERYFFRNTSMFPSNRHSAVLVALIISIK